MINDAMPYPYEPPFSAAKWVIEHIVCMHMWKMYLLYGPGKGKYMARMFRSMDVLKN